jgi:hypothetical protein
MSKTHTVDPAYLRYGLQMTDSVLVILVDLDANGGHYERLRHRIGFEFDTIAAAMRGDEVISQHGGLSFVAMVEYGPTKIETVYYCQDEPPETLYKEMESVAKDCFVILNEGGDFLRECLLPEDFLRLSISLRALCESVENGNGGKLYFVLDNNGNSVDVSSLRDAGIEAKIVDGTICIEVQDFGFEKLHRLLSCVFGALRGTVSIQGIEFDLRK